MTQIIIKEGTEPGSPSAGKQSLYIDSADNKAKLKDSAGSTENLATETYVDDLIPGSASTTEEGVVERATNAEAAEGTDTEKYVTPAQTKTTIVCEAGNSTGADGSTITFAHGLGVTPSFVRLTCYYGAGGTDLSYVRSDGTYDGTNYDCIYIYMSGNPGYTPTSSTSVIGRISATPNGSSSNGTGITVTTMDDTNVVLTNTVSGIGYGYYYLLEVHK